MAFIAKMTPERHGTRPRGRRLRSLSLAPTLLTLGNLICGFAAIHFALRAMYDFGAGVGPEQFLTLKRASLERVLPSFLSVGAGLVLLGMFLDMFDGLIARVTRSTTNFGGQLDSLADVVTFGVAPATLMVAFMTQELAGNVIPSPISDHVLGRATWMSAAIYVAMAAVRLARFNVEHSREDYDHRTFRGLPSPAAAAIMIGVILFQDQRIFPWAREVLVFGMPVIAAGSGLLMVSRLPYRRFSRSWLLGRWPIGQFMAAVLVLAVFVSWPAPTLLFVAFWYGLTGPVLYVERVIRDRYRPQIQYQNPAGDADRHGRDAGSG